MKRALIMGLVAVAALFAGSTTAGAWDGYCGSHENPIPCEPTTTPAPEPTPVPEPEPVPAPVPTVPEVLPEAAPAPEVVTPPVVAVPVPVVEAQIKAPPLSCAKFRDRILRRNAGKKWRAKYTRRCGRPLPPRIVPLPGPFNPPVTGEYQVNVSRGDLLRTASIARGWAIDVIRAAGDRAGAYSFRAPRRGGKPNSVAYNMSGPRTGSTLPRVVRGRSLFCLRGARSTTCTSNPFVDNGATVSLTWFTTPKTRLAARQYHVNVTVDR